MNHYSMAYNVFQISKQYWDYLKKQTRTKQNVRNAA